MKERVWGKFRKDKDWPKGLIVLFIVVAGAFIVLWPVVFLWALNTIFGLGIPLNFWTWLATVVILITIGVLTSAGR